MRVADRPISSAAGASSIYRPTWWATGRWRLADVALLAVVTVVAWIVLQAASQRQTFTIDESRWISTSRYFWTTFVEHDLSGPAWQPNFLVLTQPPVARYVIGFGLWLQGWAPDQLNGRYDSLQSREFNERAGNVPSAQLLADARRVVLPFAVGAAVALYCIGAQLGGRLAGLCSVGLVLMNPLLPNLWTRTLAEGTLAFLSLSTVLLALRLVAERKRRTEVGALAALGLAAGLASATKLSGLLTGGGLALYGGLAAVRDRRRWLARLQPWLIAGGIACGVFLAVNPLLYPDPLGRTLMMLQHRRDEMLQQRLNWPSQATPNEAGPRLQLIERRLFSDYATIRPRLAVQPEAVLALVGVMLLVTGSWRWRAREPAPLVLCWIGMSYVGIVTSIGFDSSHYYAPLVTQNLLLSGLAIAAAARWAIGLAWRWRFRTAQAPA